MRGKLSRLTALGVCMLGGCSGSGTTESSQGGVKLSYVPCAGYRFQPKLVAVQDGSGPWTAITPVGTTYSTTVHSTKVGLLEVTGDANNSLVSVYYALASELQNHLSSSCAPTVTDAHGTVNSLAAGENVSVSVGWNSTIVSGPGNQSFTVSTTSSTADLLAVLGNASSPAARFILRRGVPLAPIDFTKGEDFAPLTPQLTITGAAGETITVGEWYQTAGGFRDALFYGTPSATPPTTYYAMPAAKQLAGDLHEVFAYTGQTVVGGVTSGRSIDTYWHDPVARTLAFAPLPAGPTLSFPVTSPYPQLQVQWTMPAGHTFFQTNFGQVSWYVTAGYLGSGDVNVRFPDFTGLSGWQASWMPLHGVPTNIYFYDYTFTPTRSPLDYSVSDGEQEQYNHWYSAITP